jgi:hypothetical protein
MAVRYLAQFTLPLMNADGDKIHAGLRIIIALQAHTAPVMLFGIETHGYPL